MRRLNGVNIKIVAAVPVSEKYAVEQLLGWRMRGQATLKPGDATDAKRIVLAKAGVRSPIEYREVDEQNDYMIKVFFEEPHQPWSIFFRHDEIAPGRLKKICGARTKPDRSGSSGICAGRSKTGRQASPS
jgi:hypothetical protein